jgi:hypothetical protein
LALETIRIGQGDGPTLTFWLQDKQPDSTRIAYDLQGANVHLIGKTARSDDDVDAVFDYTGTVVDDGSTPGADHSIVTIEINPIDTANVVTYFAKLVANKGGTNDTVKQIWLQVSDT